MLIYPHKKLHMVKRHQDSATQWESINDLAKLKLSPAATLNVYCDRKASEAHQQSLSLSNGDVLPAEKWALFSNYPEPRKITGKLNEGVIQTLQSKALQAYIEKKHNISAEKLIHVDTVSMNNYLKALRPHNRATMVKLIHRWIPTNDFLYKQRRSETQLCLRCNQHTEDSHHILTCPDSQASTQRQRISYKQANTSYPASNVI
jgi:hypothetical protein